MLLVKESKKNDVETSREPRDDNWGGGYSWIYHFIL
jgi:hypothetical protein